MAIAKGRLEVWKPQIRIVDTVGVLGALLEPAVWVACDTYEDVSLNIRRGNALESFNYSDKVFEPTVASFRLTNRPHNFKGLDLDYYAHTYKDSDGTTIPIASSMYDSGSPPGAYYGLSSGQVRLRQRWGIFTNFFYEFQHVRLVDTATHLVLFQGRITKISKKYEDGNGSVVTIDARDALDQIANISTSNLVKKATFSTSQRRSDLIKYILNLSFNYVATAPATGPETADASPTVAELNSADGTGAMVTTDASAGVGQDTYTRFERSATVFPRETIWNAADTGSKHALSEIGRWALLDPHASTTTENVFGYDFFVDPNYGKYNLDATKGPGVAGWNSPQFNYFKRGNRLSSAGSSSQDAGVYGLTVKYPTITTARRQGARYYNIGTTAESALAATTTFSVQNGHQIRPGYVIQIGSEHMYVLAVYPDDEGVSTNDEIAVIRGFSATDAATFNTNATISYPRPAQTIMQASFNFEDTKEDLATEAVVTYNTKKDSTAASGSSEEKERLKQKRLEIMYVTEVAAGTSPNNSTPFHWDGRNMDTDFENPTFANAAETLDAYNAAGAKQADDVARIQYQSHATLTGSSNFAYILVSDITSDFPTANYSSDTYVELRGSTSGAKCRLNLTAGLTAAHEGRPSKVWGVHRVIDMGVLNNDDPTDLRKEVAARLAQATTGLRQGSYSFSKAPYYWWEGQVLNVANHADGQTIEVKNLNDTTAVKVTNFGIRAGMLVHKMTNDTFNVMSTVEVPADSGIYKDVYGYISSMTDDDTFVVDLTESVNFAADDYIKILIPIKAGTEVFVDNVIADIYGEHIITEVSFSEDPVPQTRLSSIGKNESRISGGQKVRGFVPAIAQAVFTTREQVNVGKHQPIGTQFAFLSVTVPDGSVAATRLKATWSIGYLKLLDGRVYQFLAGTTAEGTYGLGANMAVGTSYVVYLDPEGENTGPSGNYHLYTKAASDYIQDADNFPVFHVEVSASTAATSPSMRLQPGIMFDQPLPKVDANLALENASIITDLIDGAAITNAKLADLSVNGIKIVQETLVEHHYSEGSVTSNVLTNGILNGKTFVNTGLEINSGGYVRTADKESLTDSTSGFWLGRVSLGVYGMAVGNDIKYVSWDGTTLAVKGTVRIDDGELAGLTLAADKMYFATSGSGAHKNANTPFYVDSAGNFSLGALFSWTASTAVVEVKSSTSGARVELTGTGLVMYNSDDSEAASMVEGSVLKATGGIFKSNATVARSGGAGTGITNTGIIVDDTGIIGGASGVTQFYMLSSDGKAYFGAGSVVADSSGIIVTNNSTDNNFATSSLMQFKVGGNLKGYIRAFNTPDATMAIGTVQDGTLILGSPPAGGYGAGQPNTEAMRLYATRIGFQTSGTGRLYYTFPTSVTQGEFLKAALVTTGQTIGGESGQTVVTLDWAAGGGGVTDHGALSGLGDADHSAYSLSGHSHSAVTSIATTGPISGGTITSTGTITHANSGVSAAQYTNSTVTVDATGHVTAAASGSSSGGVDDLADGTYSSPTLNFLSNAGSGLSYALSGSYKGVRISGNAQTVANFWSDGSTDVISFYGGLDMNSYNIYDGGTFKGSNGSANYPTFAWDDYPSKGMFATAGQVIVTGNAGATCAVKINDTSSEGVEIHGHLYIGAMTLVSNAANMYYDGGSGYVRKYSSTERFKRNIRPLEEDSSKIYDLSVKQFETLDATYDATDGLVVSDTETGTSFGFIAEEVQVHFPSLIELDKEDKPLSVDYGKISMLLLEEVKKLKGRIEVLEGD